MNRRSFLKLQVPALAIAAGLSLALAGGVFAQGLPDAGHAQSGAPQGQHSQHSQSGGGSGQNGNGGSWQPGHADDPGHDHDGNPSWNHDQDGGHDGDPSWNHDRDNGHAGDHDWNWQQSNYPSVTYPVSTPVYTPVYTPAYTPDYTTVAPQSYYWLSYGYGWDGGQPLYQLAQTCQEYSAAVASDVNAYNPYVQQVCNTLQAEYGPSFGYDAAYGYAP